MCDELFNGCNSHKDHVSSVWMIQTQKYVSFISCIFQMLLYGVWVLCVILVAQLTYVIVGSLF
jgi:hypothetical protein